jgi:tetratricopeptide (TPR) repeat protein
MFRPPVLILTAAVLLAAPRVAAQDIPESSPDAIAAHVEGLRAYLAGDYVGSLPHFYRAHELDPTFYTPLLVATAAAYNAGMAAVHDSLWAIVKANRSRFSDYYQRRIDVRALQLDEGDYDGAMELARATAEAYPGTKAVYQYAYWGGQNGQPKLALDALAGLDPDREPMKGWISFLDLRCNSAHWLGEFAVQEQCGRDGIPRFPDRGLYHYHLADALASQGRVAEAAAPIDQAMSFPDAVGGWYGTVGLDLRAHGQDEAAARDYLQKAVGWYQALPPDRAQRPAMRRQRAYWLYASGSHEEARQALEGIVADLGSVWDRAYLGVASALTGDRATATRTLEEILDSDSGLTPPQKHYWAGLLCAAMEDHACLAEHLPQTWAGVGDHREPVFFSMRDDPAVAAFLTPRG